MKNELRIVNENVLKLAAEVAVIKKILMGRGDEEGELSDWARNSLMDARKESPSEFVSLDELEKEIKNGICD